jgi:hypothetical protein
LDQRCEGRQAVSNGYVARRIASTGDASRRQTALVLAQTLVQVAFIFLLAWPPPPTFLPPSPDLLSSSFSAFPPCARRSRLTMGSGAAAGGGRTRLELGQPEGRGPHPGQVPQSQPRSRLGCLRERETRTRTLTQMARHRQTETQT